MTSHFRVAHVAPIYSPIPPRGYGGIERVIDELLEAQQRIGMVNLRLYAPSDSRASVETRSVIPSCRSLARRIPLAEVANIQRRHYSFALRDAQDCDIIHAHGTWVLPYARLTNKPIVLTVYTDTSDPLVQEELRNVPAHVILVANSRRTQEKLPGAPWRAVVLEGVLPERYPYTSQKGTGLVFVGEMVPKKGPHLAIQVAKTLGLPLTLIGYRMSQAQPERVVRAREEYWQTEIAPYLDNSQVRSLGEMGEERLEYVKHAAAVLCPIQWEEPFGRVMAEAMACGTPVVAFRRGAAEEVIRHGVTGFVVDTLDEMINAVHQIRKICPEACREHVKQHLHMERVAPDYLAIYTEASGR